MASVAVGAPHEEARGAGDSLNGSNNGAQVSAETVSPQDEADTENESDLDDIFEDDGEDDMDLDGGVSPSSSSVTLKVLAVVAIIWYCFLWAISIIRCLTG